MVEILKTGTGQCEWSGKKCEGVFVTFADKSFENVFLSWDALKKLVRLKGGQKK